MADNSTFPEVFEDKLNPELSAEQKDHLARRLSRVRAIELNSDPVKGNLDRDHFSEIHRRLFQDVSTHAGEVRGYELSKGDTDFADQRTMDYIFETELPKRLAALADNVNEPDNYRHSMAELHDTLDEAHPFREGNGRATRMFMSQVAERDGYRLDFESVDKGRWVKASQDSIRNNDNAAKVSIMREVVQPGVERSIRVAFKEMQDESNSADKQAIIQRLVDSGITTDQIRDVKEQITQDNGHDYSR